MTTLPGGLLGSYDSAEQYPNEITIEYRQTHRVGSRAILCRTVESNGHNKSATTVGGCYKIQIRHAKTMPPSRGPPQSLA